MANEARMVYASGGATTCISLAATLADAANTYTGLGSCTMAELDNSTNNYPYAKATLNINDTFAAAPTAGGGVQLWMMKNDVDGTTDTGPVPAAADLKNAVPVGFFPIAALDVAQVVEIIISLEGVKKADFFIKNSTGQTISYTSVATTVKILPFSYGPT
jgi:hypothetical protein